MKNDRAYLLHVCDALDRVMQYTPFRARIVRAGAVAG